MNLDDLLPIAVHLRGHYKPVSFLKKLPMTVSHTVEDDFAASIRSVVERTTSSSAWCQDCRAFCSNSIEKGPNLSELQAVPATGGVAAFATGKSHFDSSSGRGKMQELTLNQRM